MDKFQPGNTVSERGLGDKEIWAVIQGETNAIDDLQKSLETLQDRLCPVMKPESEIIQPPPSLEPEKEYRCRTTLGAQMDEHRTCIQSVSQCLNCIVDRLEI